MPRTEARGWRWKKSTGVIISGYYIDLIMKNNSQQKIRISAFIDGFNLYHAIDDLGRNELKWLNLRTLLEEFIDKKTQVLGDVYYFSAYADWHPQKRTRHMVYVRALKNEKVTPVMGKFKEKEVSCQRCGHTWKMHEEKETDVNIAVFLVREAYNDSYDQAIIVSGDSDLVPPVRLLKDIFPRKKVKVICPPERLHSKELGSIAHKRAKIKTIHLERNLFPDKIASNNGLILRPRNYTP